MSLGRKHHMNSNDLNGLKKRLREFAQDRDWLQFHSPKNLSMALSGEVTEIVEHFQWQTEEQSHNQPLDKLDVDLLGAAHKKIKHNNEKYPVDKVHGSAKKYSDYK